MHRRIEVGAVLVLVILTGCGVAYEPVVDVHQKSKPVVTANTEDQDPNCPGYGPGLKAAPGVMMANSTAGTPVGGGGGPDLPCQDCDTGGGDPTEAVPYRSTYVRNLGARTYAFHPSSFRPVTVNTRMYDAFGNVIGHVSFGGRNIPEGYWGGHAQNFVSAHIYVPGTGVNMWIRFGVARAGNGQAFVWSAVLPSPYARWSPYMTVAGFKQWMNAQPVAVQNAIYAAAQAAEDTNKKEPAGSPSRTCSTPMVRARVRRS